MKDPHRVGPKLIAVCQSSVLHDGHGCESVAKESGDCETTEEEGDEVVLAQGDVTCDASDHDTPTPSSHARKIRNACIVSTDTAIEIYKWSAVSCKRQHTRNKLTEYTSTVLFCSPKYAASPQCLIVYRYTMAHALRVAVASTRNMNTTNARMKKRSVGNSTI